ncbi:MAG: flippase [Promethearchaeota archaeon]
MKQKDISTSENQTAKIHEEELEHISKGASAIFIGRILGTGISFLYTITVTRILGVKSYGIFMLALAVVNFAGVFGRIGLELGAVRYISLYNGMGDKARVKGAIISSLKISCFMSVIMIITLLIAEPIIINIFDNNQLGPLIQTLSISIPFLSIMIIALHASQGFKIMKYTVYARNLFWPASNLLLVLIFSLIGLNLAGVVMAQITSVFLTSILSIYFIFKAFPDIKDTKAILETKKLIRFSTPLLTTSLVLFLIMWTDTLMLGHFRSLHEVGIYNAATKIPLLIATVTISFNTIFSPIISDLYNKREMQKLETLFKIVTRWRFSLSILFFLLMVLFSKEIMSIFGQEFIEGLYPMIIIAFAYLVSAWAGPVGQILTMSGRQDIMMYNNLLLCFLNVVLNYLLIPYFGIIGAAVASGISLIIFEMTMLFEVYVLMKMLPHNAKIIKPIVSGIVSLGILLSIEYSLPNLNNIQKFLVYIPLLFAIFTGLIYSFGIDDEDRFVIGFVKNKFLATIKHV